MFSLIHLRTAGSAYRLSTGMSKKPWIWLAWRSIVIMWSAPATDNMLATSLAEMGALDCNKTKQIQFPLVKMAFAEMWFATCPTGQIRKNQKEKKRKKRTVRKKCVNFPADQTATKILIKKERFKKMWNESSKIKSDDTSEKLEKSCKYISVSWRTSWQITNVTNVTNVTKATHAAHLPSRSVTNPVTLLVSAKTDENHPLTDSAKLTWDSNRFEKNKTQVREWVIQANVTDVTDVIAV